MDPYSTLEVAYTATTEDIKKAYRRLAMKWHPDKNGENPDAAEMFRKIKAAYDCLMDPIKRAAMDAERVYQEEDEAAKKTKTEADKQARARAYAQPSPGRSGINPVAAMFAFIALVVMIIALFGPNNGGSNSMSA